MVLHFNTYRQTLQVCAHLALSVTLRQNNICTLIETLGNKLQVQCSRHLMLSASLQAQTGMGVVRNLLTTTKNMYFIGIIGA
jgi:hypothetical protein